MKKIKLLTCLTLALALIFGNSLTAYASEITDEETAIRDEDNIFYEGLPEQDENGKYHYVFTCFHSSKVDSSLYKYYAEITSSHPLVCITDGIPDKNGNIKYTIGNYVMLYSDGVTKDLRLVRGLSNGITYSVERAGYEQLYNASGDLVKNVTELNPNTGGFSVNATENYIYGMSTSIPLVTNVEDAEAYLATLNDDAVTNKKPVPELDETFMFIDFDVNEYVSATWSGTTFDGRIAEFDTMGYKVTAGYCFVNGSPGQIMDTQVITENGSLVTKMWKKKQLAMAHEDANLWLRYVSFTPYYEQYGQTCLGKSETIWLDPDGNTDLLPNDELTMIEDSNFYLKGVSVEESNLGIVDGDVRSYISWTGTTWDDKVSKVPLDATYADILVLCYNSSSKPVYKDLYEIDADFMGGESLPLRRSSSDSTQAFYLNTTEIDNAVSALGLTFSGKVYITPYMYYEMDNAIYKGAPTIISIFSNNIESGGGIGNGSEISPTPAPSGSPSDIPSISDEEITLDNALGVLWDVLKSLWNGMGQLPSLLYQMFPFLPVELYQFLFIGLLVIIVLRILGR